MLAEHRLSYYNSMPERTGTTPNMLQHIGMKVECRKPDLRCEKLTLQPLMYDGENKCIKSTINAQVK